MTSTQEELIRYRIEKQMGGRRDILLHALVYALVLALLVIAVPWWGMSARFFLAAFWALPLLLNVLRYYYQHGRGVRKRAAEIDRAIDPLAALDEEEETLIEDRIAKRITARRILVAHLFSYAWVVPLLWLEWMSRAPFDYYNLDLNRITAMWGAVCLLHGLRFFFVHGISAAGRALKVESEIERQWHVSRLRLRQRRQMLDRGDDEDAHAIARAASASGTVTISDEGELLFDDANGAHAAGRQVELGGDL